jgi:hypothetical protein
MVWSASEPPEHLVEPTIKNTICPYTLQPITEIDASREHVIPDALGGPNGFAVRASAAANSDWGHTIDAAFINSHVAGICASRLGLKTRSGPADLKLRGELASDGSPAEVSLSLAETEFRLRSPIVKDDKGELVAVRGYGDQAQKELDRVVADLKRKGKTVEVGVATPMDGEVHARIKVNAKDLGLGLIKIAYLANVWFLGDDFTRSEVAAIFRERLKDGPRAPDARDLRIAEIPYSQVVATLAPGVTEAHHFICSIRGAGTLTTIVRLFDEELLSGNFVVEAADLAAATQETVIEFVTVNTADGSITESGPIRGEAL